MKCNRFRFILDEDVGTVVNAYIIVDDDEILLTYHTNGRICTIKYESIVEMAKDIITFKDELEILKVALVEESERADQLEEILDDMEEVEMLEDDEE